MTPLIGIMVGGLVLAFIFGSIVHRLKVPPLVGYLLAGIVVGPFTPGYVADQKLANELALAAFLIVRAFGKSVRTALTISASLGQIGEFSFILAALGFSLGILPAEGRDLVLAGAIISIMLNPVLFYLVIRREQAVTPAPVPAAPEPRRGHVVVIGYGRMGSLVGAGLRDAGEQVIVIETENDITDLAPDDRTHVVIGNAAGPEVLAQAEIQDARLLFVAIAEPFEAGQIVEQARAINPGLRIVARAHHDSEVTYLTGKGADLAIMGEREIAKRMIEQALVPA